ncbi:hypothetical protein G6F35_018652 [Rhizopus arrhizus]|nr:hypothetical protein G6F35_018652 [Rhizopus arrhizus]
MPDQAAFDFTRADPVAGRLEHVVGAAGIPEVAVGIEGGEITRQAPIALEFGLRGRFVAPVAQEHHRVGIAVDVQPVDGDFAGFAGSHGLAVIV